MPISLSVGLTKGQSTNGGWLSPEFASSGDDGNLDRRFFATDFENRFYDVDQLVKPERFVEHGLGM